MMSIFEGLKISLNPSSQFLFEFPHISCHIPNLFKIAQPSATPFAQFHEVMRRIEKILDPAFVLLLFSRLTLENEYSAVILPLFLLNRRNRRLPKGIYFPASFLSAKPF
jgi:hypothetical protein